MNLTSIRDCIEKVKTWNPPKDAPNRTIAYIDLGSVDNESKSIAAPQEVLGKDAPSRARQLVSTGDILVSTVRPYLNGVARVHDPLDGATASTGFCVLRPNLAKIDPSFLFHWVCTPDFVDDMVRKSSGASYPAVSDRIIHESKIPLPPLPEQRRIAGILDQADVLRRKRADALSRLNALGQAIFFEMFVAGSSTEWPRLTIAEVVDGNAGGIRTGPFGSQLLHSEFVDHGIAVLGIDNAVSNTFRWAKERYISPEKYNSLRRYKVHAGDVLITIMGTCGRCAVVPADVGDAINTKHLCCISLQKSICLPEYLHAYFLHHPDALHYLGIRSKGAIMDGLNMGIIKEMPLTVPPIALQRSFVGRLGQIDGCLRNYNSAIQDAEKLFKSLQHRAFRGEL